MHKAASTGSRLVASVLDDALFMGMDHLGLSGGKIFDQIGKPMALGMAAAPIAASSLFPEPENTAAPENLEKLKAILRQKYASTQFCNARQNWYEAYLLKRAEEDQVTHDLFHDLRGENALPQVSLADELYKRHQLSQTPRLGNRFPHARRIPTVGLSYAQAIHDPPVTIGSPGMPAALPHVPQLPSRGVKAPLPRATPSAWQGLKNLPFKGRGLGMAGLAGLAGLGAYGLYQHYQQPQTPAQPQPHLALAGA